MHSTLASARMVLAFGCVILWAGLAEVGRTLDAAPKPKQPAMKANEKPAGRNPEGSDPSKRPAAMRDADEDPAATDPADDDDDAPEDMEDGDPKNSDDSDSDADDDEKTKASAKPPGDGKARKASKKKDDDDLESEPLTAGDLFGDVLLTPLSKEKDPDETPDGKSRLVQLRTEVRELCRTVKQYHSTLVPEWTSRARLIQQMKQALARKVAAERVRGQAAGAITRLQLAVPLAQGAEGARLRATLAAQQDRLNAAIRERDDAHGDYQGFRSSVIQLNQRIRPQEAVLADRWESLNSLRRSWIELRTPMEKYARGEFAELRQMLDEWRTIDDVWEEPLIWSALCSLELDDKESAIRCTKRADELCSKFYLQSIRPPVIEALNALILLKQDGQINEARKRLAAAKQALSKQKKLKGAVWPTYFVLGLCYQQRDNEHIVAKANFESALRSRPDLPCAVVALARLQLESRQDKVSDPDAGIQQLEEVDKQTGYRSARIAAYLCAAYAAKGQKDDVELLKARIDAATLPADERRLIQQILKK